MGFRRGGPVQALTAWRVGNRPIVMQDGFASRFPTHDGLLLGATGL